MKTYEASAILEFETLSELSRDDLFLLSRSLETVLNGNIKKFLNSGNFKTSTLHPFELDFFVKTHDTKDDNLDQKDSI